MKQKKQKDITLELIYKDLTGFITKQEAFNDEIKKDISDLEADVTAIKSCPTIKRELENI